MRRSRVRFSQVAPFTPVLAAHYPWEMPWLLIPVVLFLPFALVIAILRTRAFVPRTVTVEPSPVSVPRQKSLRNFQQLLRIPTVSRLDEADVDWQSFDAFIDKLAALYPKTHEALTLTRVNGYGLLYRWKGNHAGPATVLMAHYDTVPAEDGDWPHPPFSATIEDDIIWSRGAIDDKECVAGVLEAVEAHLGKGFTPNHDVYLAFGNNEETTGDSAREIVAYLRNAGVVFGLVLDEGGAVVDGGFPGVDKSLAVVGIAEKGTLDLVLTVNDAGGHASTPERLNATMRLSRAITRLGDNPFPASITPPVRQLIDVVGRHGSVLMRAVFANLWLFGPLVARLFAAKGGEPAAMVRTTNVATVLRGSAAANVLAAQSSANINIRILPGETVNTVVARVARVINDSAIEISIVKGEDPSPISRTNGPAWRLIENTIRETFPDAVPSPYLMLGASDSRSFAPYCDAVYRFSPFRMTAEVRATLHGAGEHLPVEAYLEGLAFYRRLVAQL